MDFRGDERGQPVVIGALLVFAILILAFSGYQAFVVPNQNADVEFSHSQQVQDDMVDLRVAIVRAAVGGGDTSTGVRLGTQYPSRLMALNPPPPSGSLRTTDAEEIVVNGSNEDFVGVCRNPGTTRSFVYRPNYNEFQGGSDLIYENTFAYSQHRNGETRELIKTNQRLVDSDDGVIELIALEGNYSESGTHNVGIDFVRGETRIKNVNQPEITLPTQVENRTTWEEVLEGDYTIEEFQPGEFIKFSLKGQYEVRCTPVGIDKAPKSGSANILRQASPGDGGTTTGITATSISNLDEGTNNQDQTFQFDINGVLPHNEKVIIDLTNANQNGVDYSYSGSDPASVTDGNGKASLATDGNFLNFTASQGGHEGPVTIQVSGIDVSQNSAGETFNILFTRNDTGDSDTETFEITSSN